MYNKEIIKGVRELIDKSLKSEIPSTFFRGLKGTEEMDIYFKELSELEYLDQTEKYHPEGDVFEHTMQVIDSARYFARLMPNVTGESPQNREEREYKVVLTALLHDVGKAVTYSYNEERGVIHYIDHEKMGVPIAKDFLDRFGIEQNREGILYGVESHMLMHRAVKEMRTSKLVDLIEGKFNLTGKDDKGNFLYDKSEGMRKTLGVHEFIALSMADTVGRIRYVQNLPKVLEILKEVLLKGKVKRDGETYSKLFTAVGDGVNAGRYVKEVEEFLLNKEVLERYEKEREDILGAGVGMVAGEEERYRFHEKQREQNIRLMNKVRKEVYGDK